MINRRPGPNAIVFILFTVLLDTIGFTIIISVMPDLIVELTGRELGSAAALNGYLMVLFATAQFFCAPIFGNLSDRFGRRPVLLLSLCAFSIDYLVMGFAQSFAWLFAGRALAGVFGATFDVFGQACLPIQADSEELWPNAGLETAVIAYRYKLRILHQASVPVFSILGAANEADQASARRRMIRAVVAWERDADPLPVVDAASVDTEAREALRALGYN